VRVLVVIPTYNERENVESTVDAVLDRPCAPDVLVVDDSSPDGTGALVTELSHRVEPDRVRLLTRPAKEGLGRAYADAFAMGTTDGRYDALVQMDVDGSHDPADVDRLIAALEGADLAIGSRYVPGGDVSGWSRSRVLLSRGGNLYARSVLGTHLADLTGGFKAWRTPLLRTVEATSARTDGYGFQIEMTVRALRAGARVVEVPIVFRDRERGQSKMSGRIALEALLNVPRLRQP
jgi:dolichol-phosphate mannosyltransferase